jgi:hypothetical protein
VVGGRLDETRSKEATEGMGLRRVGGSSWEGVVEGRLG